MSEHTLSRIFVNVRQPNVNVCQYPDGSLSFTVTVSFGRMASPGVGGSS